MQKISGAYGTPVVFLGKKSYSGCQADHVSDHYPFGCRVLQTLVKHFDTAGPSPESGLAGKTLVATTAVNLRGGLPTAGPSGIEVYGCKVGVVQTGKTVILKQVVALSYTGDTYYWGVTGERPMACSGKS